ncbi:hybrid sensor histidine kinase/response regulator transcription factor [Aliikangiella coralliicola]|uniref:histidine kinase n=1 Tax=Aliikangiella coralliicola TaxID=2592383 RepID=A0A545UEN4_9GAMM|nr:two-component regulator propeller domain-containing protein [Aliikangiella coralliicola]TQV87932.1 response regulator [Aliikangiella coralliicola]
MTKNTLRQIASLFLVISFSATANNPRFRSLDINDGLPFNSVRSLATDHLGYIWIGTELGLASFDGYTLQKYLADKNNPNSIADPYILDIELDSNNNLWVTSGENGLSRYNRATDNFTVFRHDPQNSNSLSANTINALQHDDNGILWVATQNGLDRFDTLNNQFTHYSHDESNLESLPSNRIRTLAKAQSGELYIGSSKGLSYFHAETNSFKTVKLKEGNQPVVRTISEDGNGKLWLGTHQGLYTYDPATATSSKFEIDSVKYVLSSLIDSENNIWIGTFQNGIYRIDESKKIINFRSDKSNAHSLTDNAIISLLQDHSGMIWAGSYTAGVNYFDPLTIEFGSFDNSINSFHCLPSNDFRSVYPINNEVVWLGTDSGLVKLNLNEKSCSKLQHDSNDNNTISHDEIYAISKGSDETYWLGTSDGLDKLHSEDDKITRYGHLFDEAAIFKIINLQDSLLLAADNGLYKFNKSSETARRISYQDGKIFDQNINTVSIDSNGTVWIASSAGLYYADSQLDSVEQAPVSIKELKDKAIRSLSIDQEENIWLTYDGEGLYLYERNSGKLQAVGNSMGLYLNHGFSGLFNDQSHNIWMLTKTQGLYKIDPVEKSFINYKAADGLHSELFNLGAFGQFPDGRLIFGGRTGLNIFHPEKISLNNTLPKVSITQLKKFGEPVTIEKSQAEKEAIADADEINLSYLDSNFGFDFIATHYPAPEKIQYAYLLEGLDNNWHYTNATNRGITYDGLNAGEYTFRLKAKSKNGIWSDDNVALRIYKTPAPWETWWAISLYIIALVLAIILIIRKRTQILAERAVALEKTVKQRTHELVLEKNKVEQLLSNKNEEFANVSHEFRTPLTLILGPIAQLLNTNKNPQELDRLNVIQRNGYRLLRMVDQLLNLETFRVKSITERIPQAIGKNIQLIAEAFIDLANEKNITIKIINREKINFEFTQDAMEKIVLNLLSNALKYTKPGGEIIIETLRKPGDGSQLNEYQIKVTDTGIGIPESKLDSIFERYNRVLNEYSEQVTGAGIGLALVKELVEAHHGRISVESTVGAGTTFTVSLPIIGEVDNLNIEANKNNEILAMELESIHNQFLPLSVSHEKYLSHNQHSTNILIIEDNPDMRRYIESCLSGIYNILVAKNGEEGVSLAKQEVPDLIISDIMMPKMDGYQVTRTIRQCEITNHIPIILLTARSDRESKLKGWYEKADEYLTKPFDLQELKLRISNLLNIRDILKKRLTETAFKEQPKTEIKDEQDIDTNKEIQQQEFIHHINSCLEGIFTNSELTVPQMAKAVKMSERQFFRKLKNITDMSPVEYLRRYRLEKAKDLLQAGKSANFSAYEVGFSSQSYFGRCFKAQFGISPGEFKKSAKT